VEATNAWRMRRTRGDIGRLLLLAAAARVAAVPVFLGGALLAAVLPVFDSGDEDFAGADLGVAELVDGF
jgi:hypothetical protein